MLIYIQVGQSRITKAMEKLFSLQLGRSKTVVSPSSPLNEERDFKEEEKPTCFKSPTHFGPRERKMKARACSGKENAVADQKKIDTELH